MTILRTFGPGDDVVGQESLRHYLMPRTRIGELVVMGGMRLYVVRASDVVPPRGLWEMRTGDYVERLELVYVGEAA